MTPSQAVVRHSSRWIIRAVLVGVGAVGAVLSAYALMGWSRDLHAENGPIEFVQLLLWTLALIATALVVRRGPTLIDRLGAGWLHTVAWLAAMRELDMHQWIRPAYMGDWGMRFRTRWWLDPAVPIAPKVLWFAVGAVVVALLVVPPLRMGWRTSRLLAARDPAAVLLIASFVLLLAGASCDDLLRNSPLFGKQFLRGTEEVLELLGVLAWAAASVGLLRRPLSVRIEAAGGPEGVRGVGGDAPAA